MRCLLIEDEPDRIAAVLPELEEIFGNGNVEVAGDRDSAIARVEQVGLDLIVLDQRIPSRPGQLDPDVIHGRAVFEQVRRVAPDTPVYFFTGLPMEDDYVDQLLAQGIKQDVWGDHAPVSLVLRFQKSTLAPFYVAARHIAESARITDNIEINTRGSGIAFGSEEARLLRCFARLHGGVCVDVALLSGGLSGSRVIRADVKDGHGNVRISVASKIGPFVDIDGEIMIYAREVVRLPAGTYAPLIPGNVARVVGKKAVFYRLLTDYDKSIFNVLSESDKSAASCVQSIRRNQKPWAEAFITRNCTIGDIVNLLVSRACLPGVRNRLDENSIDWRSTEGRDITVKICTVHGDLHGENVRVSPALSAMIIDYGSVAQLPSAIDAVTLELSPFFHPRGDRRMLRWAAGDGDIDWFDLDSFSGLCTVPSYIRETRAWAHVDGFGDREVLACAYAYVLRQLQYGDVDKDLAVALARGIAARVMRT